MGIGNSKSIDDNFFNEDIIVEDCKNIKTENIDIKKKDDFISIENNSYYTNSLEECDNKFDDCNMSDSLDEQDIEGIFATYKVEFGTKSRTMRIIEELNKKSEI